MAKGFNRPVGGKQSGWWTITAIAASAGADGRSPGTPG